MADDAAGGLLVQIGITQARMERELAAVVKNAAKSANDIEKGFTSANDNVGKSFSRSFGNIPRSTAQATTGVKSTTFAVANLTSQLNDIGVQLAGGQSPFQIMLQQGTQIGQLYAQTGGGIKGFGSLLAGAALSAISPFNLLTFAVIGLGGAAIQYFASVIGGGEDANKVIEEQQKLIKSVAQTWGEAVPALQAYVDELQRASDVADLQKATQDQTAAGLADVRKQFSDFADANTNFLDLLHKAALAPQATLHDLGAAYEELRQKIHDGTATAEDFQKVHDAVAATVAATGIPIVGQWGVAFDQLAGSIRGALGALATLQGQVGAVLNSAASTQADLQNKIQGATFPDNGTTRPMVAFIPQGDIPTPGANPLRNLSLDHDDLYGKPKKARGGGKAKGADSYKDEVTSIQDRTKALEAGTAAQAAINPLVNDFGYALEKAKTEQALLADAQKSGLTITPQLKEQISALADTYATASAKSKELAKSQDDIRKSAEEWASLEKDTFKGFLSDLEDGKSGAEALSNALKKVADKLLDMGVDALFGGKSGSAGGGNIFGSIFGGIGKLFGFASGTANTGSRPGTPVGIVHGQEAVIPLPSGGRVPVTIATPKASAQKSSHDTVSISLTDDSGRMADIANQQIHTASGTIVQVAVTQSYKQVKGNMAGLMTDAQARAL